MLSQNAVVTGGLITAGLLIIGLAIWGWKDYKRGRGRHKWKD